MQVLLHLIDCLFCENFIHNDAPYSELLLLYLIALVNVFSFFFSTENRYFSYFSTYGKCPKISNSKVSDKMAYTNSADPDQTDPEGAV